MHKFFNSLINGQDIFFQKVQSFWWTIFVKFFASIRGIKIGSNTIFFGQTKFKKANAATIHIGNRARFRSTATSNLIGVNRPCIVSALQPGAKITIGDNCGFSGTVIGCFKEISIGSNVNCGANTLITDGDWHMGDYRSAPPASIIIEDNVWLGVNVTVLKGVKVGKNSVVGAGSVVVKDIPPDCVAAGNPCKVIRALREPAR